MNSVGKVASTSAAPMGPQSVVYWPERACTPTGRVLRAVLLMKMLANISSFQHCRNV